MTEHLTEFHSISAFEAIAENAQEIKKIKSSNHQLAEENKHLRGVNKELTMENQKQKQHLREFEQRLNRLERALQERRPDFVEADGYRKPITVSYTHLTLPTIYSV